MRGSCRVCDHPRLNWINRQVAAGRKMTAIRAELGEDRAFYSALRRHVANHVANERDDAPATSAPAAPPSPEADGPPDAVEVLRSVVDELRKTDVSKLSGRLKTDHLEALRRAAETLGRMAPPAAPDEAEVNVLADRPRGIQKLVADLFLLAEGSPTLVASIDRIAGGSSLPPTAVLERERNALLAGVHPLVERLDALLDEARKRDDERGRAA